ncbi:hypothetical protein [Nonlabens ponticola]|uniref:Uncharacterized protein n=1 Tax=Nonlabens ponticola TaxID=2496866 RepID=A0A3S9MZH1_9FLAO|nr:hypothetical protein [Nonlabens ponticola]AZQ44558.1 hypothetical protein EJ995_09990 [Nonlabens ponticola]
MNETIKNDILRHLKIARWAIILNTLVHAGLFFYSVVIRDGYSSVFNGEAKYLLLLLPSLLISLYGLWLTWDKLPFKKSRKITDTIVLLFCGIIGHWLWLPSVAAVNLSFKRAEYQLLSSK